MSYKLEGFDNYGRPTGIARKCDKNKWEVITSAITMGAYNEKMAKSILVQFGAETFVQPRRFDYYIDDDYGIYGLRK